MDINFELYKIFYHAANSTGFSAAAERLFITQSAVSQAIKNLENKLGVTLFFRKTRTLKLTPEGELLFSHVSQAYNFLKLAEEKVSETQNLTSGTIRIGASDTVCKYFLLPYLQQFNQLYPNIKIQVINRTSLQILEILRHGLIDFGIVTLPLEVKNVVFQAVAEAEDIFVAAPKFNSLQHRPVKLSELTEYPILLLEKASATRRNFDDFLQQQGITIHPEIELESVDLLVEFARIGLGIAHVLRESTNRAIQNKELFELTIAANLPRRTLGTVQIESVPISRAARMFLDTLPILV